MESASKRQQKERQKKDQATYQYSRDRALDVVDINLRSLKEQTPLHQVFARVLQGMQESQYVVIRDQ